MTEWKIESILGLRHAHTEKNAVDSERSVSDKGNKQIEVCRKFLNQAGFLKPITAGFYGVRRQRETLEGILIDTQPIMLETPTLYLPEDPAYRSACEAVFKKYGYSEPIETWLAEDTEHWIPRYASLATTCLLSQCRRSGTKHCMFVGSFNLINSIGLLLTLIFSGTTGFFRHSILETLLKTKFGECEGFRLSFSKDRMGLELIRQPGMF